MHISDGSSDVCSSDLRLDRWHPHGRPVLTFPVGQWTSRKAPCQSSSSFILIKGPSGAPGGCNFGTLPALPSGIGHRASDGKELQSVQGKLTCQTEVIPRETVQNRQIGRSEEHTSEIQSLMRISYAVFSLQKK